MFSSPEPKEESSSDIAYSLYSILISTEGQQKFRRSFAQKSENMIRRLNDFYNRLIKTGFFTTLANPEEDRRKLRETIDKFVNKIRNISDKDFERIREIIDTKYFKNNLLVIEGVSMGIADWIREYISIYYELVEQQNKMSAEDDIIKYVLEAVQHEHLAQKKKILEYFALPQKLSNQLKESPPNEKLELLEKTISANKMIIRSFIREQYMNTEFLQRVCLYNEKKTAKLEKRIAERLEQMRAFTDDRRAELDDEIFTIIQMVFFELVKLRSRIMPKELKKALARS